MVNICGSVVNSCDLAVDSCLSAINGGGLTVAVNVSGFVVKNRSVSVV